MWGITEITPTQCKAMNHHSQFLIPLNIKNQQLELLLIQDSFTTHKPSFIIQRKANPPLAINILQIGTNKA